MKKKENIIFETEEYLQGILNVIAVILIIIGTVFYFEKLILSIKIVLILVFSFIVFLIANKRWFKAVKIGDEKIIVNYPFNFTGAKKENILYEEIIKVVYYEYMYRTPAHIKLMFKNNKVLRFRCSLKDANTIFDFLKTKEVEIVYYDEKKVKYRGL